MSRPEHGPRMWRTHPGAAAAQIDQLDIEVPDQADPDESVAHAAWLSQLQTDVALSLGGMLLRGTRPVQLGTASGAMTQMSGGGGRLCGWSIHETTGANYAVVRFYDGRSVADGALVAIATIPAGGSSTISLPSNGASFIAGLFCDLSQTPGNASVEGAAYLGAAD